MTHSFYIPGVAAVVSFAIAGAAGADGEKLAQTRSNDQQATFESLDKNSDGKVSLNEAAENDALFVAFKDLDANKDGDLTKEEYARYKGKSGA